MNREDAEEYTQALGQVVAGGWRQVALGKRLGVPAALGLSVEEWVQDRLGGYVRLSIPERREAVAELIDEGMSNREAAAVLGVAESTVRNDKAAAQDCAPLPDDASSDAGSQAPPAQDCAAEPEPTAGELFTEAEVKAIFAKGPPDHARRDLSALIRAAMALRQNEAGLVEHLAEHGREDREEVLYDLSEYVERVVAFCRGHLQPGLKAVK